MDFLTYYTWREKGRRAYMEDEYGVIELAADASMFWVADGHGGSQVSKYISENISMLAHQELVPGVLADKEQTGEKLTAMFTTLNDMIGRDVAESGECGSTLLIAVVTPAWVVIANAGDSRAVWGPPLQCTQDHGIENNKEVDRIYSAGGFVFKGRLLGSLSVFRSLGDNAYRPFISEVPDIVTYDVKKGGPYTLALSTDGVFEILENEDVYTIAKKRDTYANPAHEVVTTAMIAGSMDNLSCIVVHIHA
jgi:serine/threonine protein phosphatase PrpC